MRTTRPRIFVDVTGIDFRTRTTGIPRVALAYLEEGYALEAEGGPEVLPVHVVDGVLRDARPLLWQSNVRRWRRHPGLRPLWQIVRSAAWFTLHALRLVLVACVTPLLVVAEKLFTFDRFDLCANLLRRAFRRGYDAFKRGLNRVLLPPMACRPGDCLLMPGWWHDTPPGHYAQLRRKGLRLFPLVHDLLPIARPEFYEAPWRDQFRSWVFPTLRQCEHVYCVSEATRRSVLALGAALDPDATLACSVVHHGYDFVPGGEGDGARHPAVRALLADGRPFFLLVGSLEPKKCHLAVLAEFEALWREGREVRLVVAGAGGWQDGPIREALRRSPHLHDGLVWLEGLPDGALAALYRHAHALIQASVAEGFGLPVIEALAVGTRVLANDIEVFREIAGPAATYFDIQVRGALARRVREALEAKVRPVHTARVATWRECAARLYSDMLARRAAREAPRPGAASAEEPLRGAGC